ncbi:hypothetical protein [Microbispora sp. H10885]|nr:hypothetical protein [Microbispora sp. H10885]
MRGKGISYGTGFVENGAISRKRFDPAVVGEEMLSSRTAPNARSG